MLAVTMNFTYLQLVISLTVLLSSLYTIHAIESSLQCGACLALVDEINYSISQVDPRKTLQVGSFRVDGKGNQNTYKVPYARSELHLTEELENVCEKMNQYAESTDQSTNLKSYMRTSSRNGEAITLSNVKIDGEVHKSLRFACETLIEEHEEEFLKLFKKDEPDIEVKMCVEHTEVCEKSDIEAFKDIQSRKPEIPTESEDEEDDGDDEDAVDITEDLVKNSIKMDDKDKPFGTDQQQKDEL